MKRTIFAATLFLIIWCDSKSYGDELRFERASDHCYYLQLVESGENVGIIATDEGAVMVNSPQESDLSLAVSTLKHITSKPVRWVVFTDYNFARAANARFFVEQGTQVLISNRLRSFSKRIVIKTDSSNEPVPKSLGSDGNQDALAGVPELSFDGQVHLFPSNLEIRIFQIKPKSRTGGDVVIYVPAEKVLFVGDLFEADSFPTIDTAAEGTALGWIEGLKQAIDSVPLLKSAIALQPKPVPKTEPEKTLEEKVAVISVHGKAANLQNMKDLLEVSQKLRTDISRAIRAGRTWDGFIASPVSEPYRRYGNLASFSAKIFEELKSAAAK
jgi:cyclase